MAYDFKKEQKPLYAPAAKPLIVDVPAMTFVMVDGVGDPNTSIDYANAIAALYGFAYAVKMSKMGEATPPGYFDFVVPPLEGLWSVTGQETTSKAIDKDRFLWTSMIRVPDFVNAEVFSHFKGHFKGQLAAKKPEVDLTRLRIEVFTEGLCGQITHVGPYAEELATIQALERFIEDHGYRVDMSTGRRHHEIYLGDPRRVAPEKLKTIIRHPIVRR